MTHDPRTSRLLASLTTALDDLAAAPDAYTAQHAYESVEAAAERIRAHALTVAADTHSAAALARHAGTTRQAMTQRVQTARTRISEWMSQ
jgi:hypothetical protein